MTSSAVQSGTPSPHAAREIAREIERAMVQRASAVAALSASVKTLPPSLFYDETGARLFEEICDLPEYYLTRTEVSILSAQAPRAASLAGPHAALIEYGSGAGVKVRFLLDALDRPAAYVPVDVSEQQLRAVAARKSAEYPHIPVRPVCADYTHPFELAALPATARRVAFFPGSTIGNFHPAEAAAFLARVRHAIGPDGALILGVDRRKDPAILHAAYNDAAGVTAAFNLNVLTRLNREMDATFDLSLFRHRAFFNDHESRIEMHLESLVHQNVRVAGTSIHFRAGETIHTECSYKYDAERLGLLLGAAGFRADELWTDERDWFWVGFLTPA